MKDADYYEENPDQFDSLTDAEKDAIIFYGII
jgi:hypothetical protein